MLLMSLTILFSAKADEVFTPSVQDASAWLVDEARRARRQQELFNAKLDRIVADVGLVKLTAMSMNDIRDYTP